MALSGWSDSQSSNPLSQADTTFTPVSGASTFTAASFVAPPETPGALDLGPPAYFATIKLREGTPQETIVYLGPWEILGSKPRCIVWQCSYEGEVLEHILPSENPAGAFPFTLHTQHRRFTDPRDMELYLTFREPHRIRYTGADGLVAYDDRVEVRYEFTTVDGSVRFQSDLRNRMLVDWFDVDVVWSDVNKRTDSYGSVRGLGTIQRLKLWRDQASALHSLAFYANHKRQWCEFLLQDFEREPRQREDRNRRLQLNVVASRRGSTGSNSSRTGRDRRFLTASIFRRGSSSSTTTTTTADSNTAQAEAGSPAGRSGLGFKVLGIQFSRNDRTRSGTDDLSRFLGQWHGAHSIDAQIEPSRAVSYVEPDMTGQPASDVPTTVAQGMSGVALAYGAYTEMPYPMAPLNPSAWSEGGA